MRVKEEAKSCGEVPLYQAALYLWQTDRLDKARELVDKLLKLNPDSISSVAHRDPSLVPALLPCCRPRKPLSRS